MKVTNDGWSTAKIYDVPMATYLSLDEMVKQANDKNYKAEVGN